MHVQKITGVIVGGHDHFIAGADFEGAQGKLDGKCAAGTGQSKLDSEILGQPLFQTRYVFAVIFTPGAIAKGLLQSL